MRRPFSTPGSERPNTAKPPPPTRAWPPGRMWLIFVLVLVANFAITRFFTPGEEPPIAVPYTVFKDQVAKGNVEAIYSRGADAEGLFRQAGTYPPAKPPAPDPPAKGLRAADRAT